MHVNHKKDICPKCGNLKDSRSKLCLKCFRLPNKKTKCPVCGKELSHNYYTHCRKHRLPMSEKTKKKISIGLQGNHCSPSGKDNHLWRGGITPQNMKIRQSREMTLWRKSCMERDNFTCQKCLKNGGELNVHHIHNFADFPDVRMAIDNGITLCKDCHKEFHKIYGNKNNTKEQLEELLINN